MVGTVATTTTCRTPAGSLAHCGSSASTGHNQTSEPVAQQPTNYLLAR